MSWASAPLIVSSTRNEVTPRIEDAAGITTCVMVPGLVTTVTGLNAPAVIGRSALTADMTAW